MGLKGFFSRKKKGSTINYLGIANTIVSNTCSEDDLACFNLLAPELRFNYIFQASTATPGAMRNRETCLKELAKLLDERSLEKLSKLDSKAHEKAMRYRPSSSSTHSECGREPPPDYYAILGVEPSATRADIRSAYLRLSGIHHPDRGGETTVFQRINEANETLSNPDKKGIYDALLASTTY